MILHILNTLFTLLVAYIMYTGIKQETENLHPGLKIFAVVSMLLAGVNFVSLFFPT